MMERTISYLVLFLVIPLYTAQGWLFESGSLISQTLILFWLIINVFYTLEFLFHKRTSSVALPVFLFLILIFFSWLFFPKVIISHGWVISTYGDLKNISLVMLSYFPFRYWGMKGYLQQRQILLFLVLMILASVEAFFLLARKFDAELLTIINNTGYYFAMLFPVLGILFAKKINLPIIAVLMYFCIGSAKRGAILCLVVCLILYFYYSNKGSIRKNLYSKTFLFLIMSVVISALAYNLYETNAFLQNRIERTVMENDTGGREYIYSQLVDYFFNSDIISMLFGSGMDKTVEIAGNFAHQDWLELLICNGIIGIILYLAIFVSMYKYYKENRKYIDNSMSFLFLSTFCCWLLKSFFSMGYTHFFSFIFLAEYALFECKVIENKKRYKLNKL